MKLKVITANNEHDVFVNVSDRTAVAKVDGREYELQISDTSDKYLLLNGTRVHRCIVQPMRGAHNSFAVTLSGKMHSISIIDPKRARSGETAGAHGHGAAEIVSPMPGKVVRVLVEVGAAVEVGAGVMVVEAMKMQNELKSPKAGVVASINAAPGATVNAGDVLAVIE